MTEIYTSWLNKNGASQKALSALCAAVGQLPVEYVSLLSRGNGGEVALTVSPFNLCLDSAEESLSYWKSGTYPLQGVFVFGGNGAGDLIAIDMRQPAPWSVIHFDPIDPEGSIETVAVDFSTFLGLVSVNP